MVVVSEKTFFPSLKPVWFAVIKYLMQRILLIIVFFPLIGCGQTPNSVLSAELDAFIQNQMASNNIPGLSTCIVKEKTERIIYLSLTALCQKYRLDRL